MKKIILIFFVLLNHACFSQITLVNNTNLNGFATTNTVGSITRVNGNSGVLISGGWGPNSCHLDTLLNLICYDSLRVIFTMVKGGYLGGAASVNGINAPNTQTTYTISTLNIAALSLSVNVFSSPGWPVTNVSITNLKIVGYQSSGSCTNTPSQPLVIFGPTLVCTGAPVVYSITPLCGATNYSWYLPGGWSGSSSIYSISAIAGSSGNLSVSVTNSCGTSPVQILNVTANGSPPVMPGPINGFTSFCVGFSPGNYSINLVPGAANYIWTNPVGWTGASGTNIIGLTPNGNSGTLSVAAVNACGTSSIQTVAIMINPLPTVNISSSSSLICSGETATLIASGAISYTWGGGINSNTIAVSPTVNTSYILVGMDGNGCINQTTVSITVSPCTILMDNILMEHEIAVYPNPFSDVVWVTQNSGTECKYEIYNSVGELILRYEFNSEKVKLDLDILHKGFYYLIINTDVTRSRTKLLKD